MDEFTMGTLRATAAEIVTHLHANGFEPESAVTRNLLCLAEEAGEVVGAYRWWSGQARRLGTLAELGWRG